MKLTLATGLFVAASAAAFAQAPAGSATTQGTSPQRQGSNSSPQQNSAPSEQTLTGCLTSADRIYTLTVIDNSGGPGNTAQSTSYTLEPGTGVDLQPYLNKRVTVKGSDAGPAAQTPNRIETKTPTAQATAKARINSKAFNVTTVQPATGSCGA